MKRILIIVWCYFFISFVAFGQKEISVPLIKKNQDFPFTGGRSFGSFEDSIQKFKLDSNDYSLKGVWKFSFEKPQNAFNDYLRKNRKDSLFEKRVVKSNWDTSYFSKTPIENAVYVFVGINKAQQLTIIADENNNLDFRDDKPYYYPIHKPSKDSLKNIIEKIPTSNLSFNIWHNGKFIERHLNIKFILKQYLGNFKIHFSNPTADSLLIVAASKEHLEGNFTVIEKQYTFFVNNRFPSPRFSDPPNIEFYAERSNKKINSQDKSYSFNELGDTLPIGNELYKIKRLDPLGNFVLLSYAGASQGLGIDKGYFAKSIDGTDVISGKLVKFEDLKGKYLLLDFWGTWCIPCKQILPGIKALKEKYYGEGFQLVSIAFDKDREILKKHIESEQMNWINLWDEDSDTKRKELLSSKYKVTEFPTTILIDPKGKILFRDSGIPGFHNLEVFLTKYFGR